MCLETESDAVIIRVHVYIVIPSLPNAYDKEDLFCTVIQHAGRTESMNLIQFNILLTCRAANLEHVLPQSL